MIMDIEGLCDYKDCKHQATKIACGRKGESLGCYCDEHAAEVADEASPEYHVDCPNCGCLFGVN